jgi:hypothetical protein
LQEAQAEISAKTLQVEQLQGQVNELQDELEEKSEQIVDLKSS